MKWTPRIADRAAKQLARFPARDRQRIIAALQAMRADPLAGDVKRLHGERSAWRRRVGSYRIFYDLDSDRHIIDVLEIARRTSTTY